MIGKLKGTIDSLAEDHAILDVHGVGFVVHCPGSTLQKLPKPGEAAALLIETQVREDSIKLFGFHSEAERDWFRLLQTVQGVGAKVALAIQSVLGAPELAGAIASQNKGAIARAPGVGPKLAARIIAELKDKAAACSAAPPLPASAEQPAAAQDAVMALVNLGYGRPQASAAVAASLASLGAEASAADLIRFGLKELSR
ncbi:MAG TPA: Holliday junction branch migration protein RuvA [Methylocella sp.]|nr:Holliday junction branch migration protein RuvA [Methylocella sp.]